MNLHSYKTHVPVKEIKEADNLKKLEIFLSHVLDFLNGGLERTKNNDAFVFGGKDAKGQSTEKFTEAVIKKLSPKYLTYEMQDDKLLVTACDPDIFKFVKIPPKSYYDDFCASDYEDEKSDTKSETDYSIEAIQAIKNEAWAAVALQFVTDNAPLFSSDKGIVEATEDFILLVTSINMSLCKNGMVRDGGDLFATIENDESQPGYIFFEYTGKQLKEIIAVLEAELQDACKQVDEAIQKSIGTTQSNVEHDGSDSANEKDEDATLSSHTQTAPTLSR